MKQTLLFLFALLIFSASAQTGGVLFTSGPTYTDGVPMYNPGTRGSRIAVDYLTKKIYTHVSGTTWALYGNTLQTISGCSAPAYTPTGFESDFVVNNCDSLYRYRGGAWHHLNAGGSGGGGGLQTLSFTYPNLSISGGNSVDLSALTPTTEQQQDIVGGMVSGNTETLISVTYDDPGGKLNFAVTPTLSSYTNDAGFLTSEVDGSTTNELQNLSISGQTLSISGGTGATLPVVGISAGSGISVSPASGVYTITNNAPDQTVTISGTTGTYPNFTVTPTDISGLLVKSANLSDLTSASTARSNLGLGSLATQSGTFSGTHSGNSSGTNTGDQANITGNSGSATVLQTLRNINGVAFDGSANITVTVPISTGVTGLGSNVSAFLATPSSANLAGAVTDETGSGLLVFGTSPTLTTPVLGVATANKITVAGQYASTRFALTDGATIAVDWDNGNVQSVILGGNRTVTFANPKDGGRYLLIIKQDGTGSRTITWPTIKWPGGTTPTLTTTINKYDIISIVYDGTNYYGTSTLNF